MRQMTFSVPDDVADDFAREVPVAEQPEVIAKLLQRGTSLHRVKREMLIAACEAANSDPDLNADVDEWQAFNDPIEESWDDSSAR